MKKLEITEQIWKEGNMFTSYCPELDVASCGYTIEEAKKNLRQVIEIQLEETAKLGTLVEFLEEAGYSVEKDEDIIRSHRKIIESEKLEIPLEYL